MWIKNFIHEGYINLLFLILLIRILYIIYHNLIVVLFMALTIAIGAAVTLGAPLIGYLGYRGFKWAVNTQLFQRISDCFKKYCCCSPRNEEPQQKLSGRVSKRGVVSRKTITLPVSALSKPPIPTTNTLPASVSSKSLISTTHSQLIPFRTSISHFRWSQALKVLNSLILKEPDETILRKATAIIDVFKDVYNRSIDKELNFQMVEDLKSAKRSAKEILKNTSIDISTRQALQEVIKQYDCIVESIEILTMLRQMSREIRKPQSESPMLSCFNYAVQHVFNGKYNSNFKVLVFNQVIKDLMALYQSDLKPLWEKRWSTFREYMWTMAMESQSFLENGKKVVFITGSTTASIPLIVKTPQIAPELTTQPALIPTGKLLAYDIAPLTGELQKDVYPMELIKWLYPAQNLILRD